MKPYSELSTKLRVPSFGLLPVLRCRYGSAKNLARHVLLTPIVIGLPAAIVLTDLYLLISHERLSDASLILIQKDTSFSVRSKYHFGKL